MRYRIRFIALCVLTLCIAVGAQDPKPFFFIQLTDPQFGMYAADSNTEQETANFEFAIATANRLKPAFVIVTGDLLNKGGDPLQTSEYLRAAVRLNPAIKLYNLPGNHDLGNVPTPESLRTYRVFFGPDYYTFRLEGTAFFVLNSTLIHSPQGAPDEYQKQETWLKAELEKAKLEGMHRFIVIQHHPLFLERPDEPDKYENIPLERRRKYLDLFKQYGVSHLFSGHLHRNQIARYGTMELIVTGPIGKPLGKDPSGMRIVKVRAKSVEHQYIELGNIPNAVDPAK
jgi:serine/threonine-protein phosphatase CPPED1